ncbi:MAG: hypothetical protein ACHP84_04220 [Caulobacterales bacterium]
MPPFDLPMLPRPRLVGVTREKKRYMVAEKVMGRPPVLYATEETLKRIARLGKIQCTVREVAAALGVAESTLMLFFNDVPEARDVYEDAKLAGMKSLRRVQFDHAKKNVAMAIFLGKNYLDQSDRNDVKLSGQLSLEAWILQSMGEPAPVEGQEIEGHAQLVEDKREDEGEPA